MKRLKSVAVTVLGFIATATLLISCGGSGGGSDGGDNTPSPPTVTTLGSSMISDSTERVSGSINPNGKDTEYWFEWSTDESLANPTTAAIQTLGASTSEQMVSYELTGLSKGSLYYYRLCAQNTDGMVQGTVKTCYHYANVVFVTSAHGTGDLGSWAEAGGNTGIAAGDAICQTLAGSSGLQGDFKAWLSDSTIAARDRLAHSAESYLRVDGARVGNNWSDFTTTPYLDNPISITEQGLPDASPPYWVWTGTRVGGDAAWDSDPAVGNYSCLGWSSSNNADGGAVGGSQLPGWEWTEWGWGSCNGSHPLYCFQQDLALPQEHFSTGCPGPLGWVWHVSACSEGLYQDPDCAYICCNFYNPTNNCYDLPATFGGYTVTSCSYNTGRYSMAVTHNTGNFNVTCEVE